MPKQATPSSFSATVATASSRTAFRRPLCQPAHTLEEVERHKKCDQQGKQPDPAGGGGSVARRGRRARRQMHPNLSEAMMEAVAFGEFVDSGDDAEDSSGKGRGDQEGATDAADAEAPLRFRTSSDAPWGAGDQPLIKVIDSFVPFWCCRFWSG